MKFVIFSDIHWDSSLSVVRSRGERYSLRLEHLINSMNFVNKIAKDYKCDVMICAGDYFNKSRATDEELTATKEIMWNDLPCYFVCGNHESSVSDLRYSVLKVLESDNHFIINSPKYINFGDKKFLFLPYIVESDRKNLSEYVSDKPDVIISHNDIQGINYGGFTSTSGFSIDEIEENCDLYLNGHLHNSEWITNKILNVGSFSGHNFTNDSFRYKYGIWILDTDTMKVEFIENPYGFNFYKIVIENEADLAKFDNIKQNAVVSITCIDRLYSDCINKLNTNSNIIEKRLVTVREKINVESIDATDLHDTDYLQKLVVFCQANIENSAILSSELSMIIK